MPLDIPTLLACRVAIAEIQGEQPPTVDEAFERIGTRLVEFLNDALRDEEEHAINDPALRRG